MIHVYYSVQYAYLSWSNQYYKVIGNRSTFLSGSVTSCSQNVKYFCHQSVDNYMYNQILIWPREICILYTIVYMNHYAQGCMSADIFINRSNKSAYFFKYFTFCEHDVTLPDKNVLRLPITLLIFIIIRGSNLFGWRRGYFGWRPTRWRFCFSRHVGNSLFVAVTFYVRTWKLRH
jgi:hypothetical protein